MCESMRRKNRAKAKAMVAKIINSNKSGYRCCLHPSRPALSWGPALVTCHRKTHALRAGGWPLGHTWLLPPVPREAEDEDTQNGKIHIIGEKSHLRFIKHQVSRIHRQKNGTIEAAGWRWHSRPGQNPLCHHHWEQPSREREGGTADGACLLWFWADHLCTCILMLASIKLWYSEGIKSEKINLNL